MKTVAGRLLLQSLMSGTSDPENANGQRFGVLRGGVQQGRKKSAARSSDELAFLAALTRWAQRGSGVRNLSLRDVALRAGRHGYISGLTRRR